MLSLRRRQLPLLLATLVALRALVPIGYMLSLPFSGISDWALHLCPTQNPTLDLALFDSLQRHNSSPHQHGVDHGAGAADNETAVSLSADCNAWLASAALAFTTVAPGLLAQLALAVPPAGPGSDLPNHTRHRTAQVRAPPTLSA